MICETQNSFRIWNSLGCYMNHTKDNGEHIIEKDWERHHTPATEGYLFLFSNRRNCLVKTRYAALCRKIKNRKRAGPIPSACRLNEGIVGKRFSLIRTIRIDSLLPIPARSAQNVLGGDQFTYFATLMAETRVPMIDEEALEQAQICTITTMVACESFKT
jgi:hypothetical protein